MTSPGEMEVNYLESKGFWPGLLAGGILGTAITLMYMNAPREKRAVVRRITGKLRETGTLTGNMGGEVTGMWKK